MVSRSEIVDVIRHADLAKLDRCKRSVPGFPDGCCEGPMDRQWAEVFASAGSLAAVRWLIENLKDGLPGYRPRQGTSDYPLVYAAVERTDPEKHDVLQTLIDAGADIHARGLNDYTPAHLAAVYGDLRSLEILRDAGADFRLRTRIDHELTPLEEALDMVGENSATRALQDWLVAEGDESNGMEES